LFPYEALGGESVRRSIKNTQRLLRRGVFGHRAHDGSLSAAAVQLFAVEDHLLRMYGFDRIERHKKVAGVFDVQQKLTALR